MVAGSNDKPKNQLPPKEIRRRERYITVASILSVQRNKTNGVGRNTIETKVPWIRMQGKWLEQAGFDVCTRVRIRVMAGCLVLTID